MIVIYEEEGVVMARGTIHHIVLNVAILNVYRIVSMLR